jgi:hypothetical protein
MRYLVPLLIFLASIFCQSSVHSQNTLRGGIQHEERLSRVNKNLKPGIPLKEKGMSDLPSADQWFEIPAWLAGTWMANTAERFYRYNEINRSRDTSKEFDHIKIQETFGWRRDSSKGIWTCSYTGVPKELTNSSKENPEQHHRSFAMRENFLHQIKPNGDVVLMTYDTVVTTDDKKNNITSTKRSENIRTLHRMGPDLIASYEDIRAYDEEGFPQERIKRAVFYHKVSDFTPRDEYKGRSLKTSFNSFMNRVGKLKETADK